MSGGGDGGAAEREEERQQEVQDMVSKINSVFDDPSRSDVYDTAGQAVFDLDSDSIEDNYNDTKRGLDFSLARSGLFGGSNDINRNAELNDATSESLMNARLRSDGLKAMWEGEDETLRSSLASQAAADPDSINIEATRNRLNAASDERAATGLDSSLSTLFDDFNNAYNINRYNKAVTTGYTQGSKIPTPGSPSTSYQGG